MNNEYITISEVNKYIKNVIDEDAFLSKIYIKGEISNLKFHTSGHLYFSLKDESSKINAVMFSFSNNKLLFTPKDGDNVLIRGRISVYESSGSYQVYVEEMLEDGVGNLYILYEELKQRLSKEGLFDEEHKKKIPKIPSTVGVITAPTGAAVKDIISTINKRFPMTNIILFPTLVQGEGAKENIVAMIKKANKLKNVDVIILGRGGGSIEDLWAFNEEIVARAIFDSEIPIISAVGHEIDFTISDFVADLRAPTPTGGAMIAVPDKNEVMRYIFEAKKRSYKAILNKIENYGEKLERFKTSYILKNPRAMFEVKEQKLDRVYEKIGLIIKNIINKNEHIFENYKLKLDLLNPSVILSKGYSIIKKDEKVIKHKKDITPPDNLKIIVSDGEVTIKVSEVII